MNYAYDRRQLMALAFVALLAPAARLMPRMCAQLGGSSGWLSPLIAAPFIIIYVWMLASFMRSRKPGEGLGELILRTNGRVFGSFVLCVTALYLIFCCGFILRSGAERFVCTIYPEGGPWPFIIIMYIIGTLAAFGPEKALVRSARIFAPVLIAVFVVVLILAMTTIEPERLLPVSAEAPQKLLLAAVPTVEIFAGVLAYTAFIEDKCEIGSRRVRAYTAWLVPLCILISAMCVACIGNYGAQLTARFSYPFFSMIRNLTLFHTIERIEAIVVTLWVLPDFVIYALMLNVASHLLRLVLGFVPEKKDVPWFDMRNGRWIIAVCAVIIFAVAVLLNIDADNISFYSETVIPIGNIAVVMVLVPVCLLVCRLRRKC